MVDTINQDELKKLETKKYIYNAKIYNNKTELPSLKAISQKNIQNEMDTLMKNGMFEEKIRTMYRMSSNVYL